MRYRSLSVAILALLAVVSACEVIDRDDTAERAAAPEASAGGVVLALEGPGVLRPGEDALIRVSLANRADTAVHGIRAELLLPQWMEPAPPEATGTPVTMVTSPEGEVRLVFTMADSLRGGETRTVTQRIRTPALVPGATSGTAPWGRVLRARLVGAAGESLAEVESEVTIDTAGLAPGAGTDTAGADSAAGAGGARDSAVVGNRGVGPVRLGMSADALRRSAPGARDTTWTAEGTQERGMTVPAGGGAVVAVLTDGTVSRIVVPGRGLRTEKNIGVGSTMEELRRAYGPACADVGEGRVAVWFAAAPEISFALSARPPRNAGELRENPGMIPDSATVTSMWLRQGATPCPKPS